MHPIRPAEPGELRAALSLLLARPETTPAELQCQIDTLMDYTSRQGLSLTNCLVFGDPGRIEAACLCVDAPGRTSSVFIPNHLPTPARAERVVALLIEAAARARGRDIGLMQGIIEPEAHTERGVYARAGFQRLTELIYLERDAVHPAPRTPPAPPLEWQDYGSSAHAEFAAVIEGSYVGSLDCAALSGVRDIEDALASHRAAGEFDPRCWLLARAAGEAVGILLLARVPERGSLEIVYMGLLPHARGRGYGATLLRRAIEMARSRGVSRLTLTVDVENAPARRLYAAFDFEACARREVWMRILPKATSS